MSSCYFSAILFDEWVKVHKLVIYVAAQGLAYNGIGRYGEHLSETKRRLTAVIHSLVPFWCNLISKLRKLRKTSRELVTYSLF